MKEIYKIKIEPLTAVHIGSGNSLLPVDYTLEKPNGSTEKRYVKFSSDKIINSILESGTAQQKQELQNVSDLNDINALAKFFRKYFYLGVEYDSKVTKDFINLYSSKINSGLFENSLEVNQILHHGAKPYIPGSSIKGAVRTAILNQALMDLPQESYNELLKMADKEKQRDSKKYGRYEKKIQNKALEKCVRR